MIASPGEHLATQPDPAGNPAAPSLRGVIGAAVATVLVSALLVFGIGAWLRPRSAETFFALRGLSILVLLGLLRLQLRLIGARAADVGLAVDGRTLLRGARGAVLGTSAVLLAFSVAWMAGGYSVAPAYGTSLIVGAVWFKLGLYLVGALFEELAFRVGVLGVLRLALPTSLAVAVQAAVFGLLHAHNPDASTVSVLNTMLGGVLLGLLFLERGGKPRAPSLGLVTGFHFAWNAAQSELLGLPVSGYAATTRWLDIHALDIVWSGGSYGMEGGLGVSLVFVALVVLTAWRTGRGPLSTPRWAPSPR